MAISLSLDLRNALAGAMGGAFDGGATFEIFDGSLPATPTSSNSGDTKLATVTLPSTAFGSAAGGSVEGAGLPWEADGTIEASGTAQYYRLTNGSMVIQGTVGTSNADFIVTNPNFVQGGSFEITGFTLTINAGG